MAASSRVHRLTPVDAAYLAGLIDGEGTIALTRRHRGDHRQLVLSISSTESSLVDWARDTIGAGKITSKRVYRPNHAAGLTYSIANRQALDVLGQVTPFLRSYKRERAQLILDRYLAVTPRNGKYSTAQRSARAAFEREFEQITIRGRTGIRAIPKSYTPPDRNSANAAATRPVRLDSNQAPRRLALLLSSGHDDVLPGHPGGRR